MMDTRDTSEDNSERPDYAVGRNRPPVASQFKKGNNLGRGRPPGAPNVSTAFNNAFEKKRRVQIDGRSQSRAKSEIAMEQLANKAAAGDPKAISLYLTYAEKFQVEKPEREVPRHEQETNLGVIDNMLALREMAKRGLAAGQPETRNDD